MLLGLFIDLDVCIVPLKEIIFNQLNTQRKLLGLALLNEKEFHFSLDFEPRHYLLKEGMNGFQLRNAVISFMNQLQRLLSHYFQTHHDKFSKMREILKGYSISWVSPLSQIDLHAVLHELGLNELSEIGIKSVALLNATEKWITSKKNIRDGVLLCSGPLMENPDLLLFLAK